jgi:hypothetical protein
MALTTERGDRVDNGERRSRRQRREEIASTTERGDRVDNGERRSRRQRRKEDRFDAFVGLEQGRWSEAKSARSVETVG